MCPKQSNSSRTKSCCLLNIIFKSIKYLSPKIFGLLLGVFLVTGFYHGILIDLELDEKSLGFLSLVLTIFIGIGCTFSNEIQCVGIICLSLFLSRHGRRTLQALLFTYLLAGPINNIINNSKEVSRTFGCSAELSYNLTKEYTDLIVSPFKDAILSIKEDDANSVGNAIREIKYQIKPLKADINADENEDKKLIAESDYVDKLQENSLQSKEINEKYKIESASNVTEGEIVEKKYLKSLEIKCHGIIARSTQRCRELFNEYYDKCKIKINPIVSWLLCWPMKLTFICDVLTLMSGGKACDADEHTDPGYGDAYNTLSNIDKNLEQQIGHTEFHYKLPKNDFQVEIKDASSSIRNVIANINVKLDAVSFILIILRRIIALFFLPVILESVNYLNKYLLRPEHDNIYFTNRFKNIDQKRKNLDKKPILLPFKKHEQIKLVNLFSILPNGPEKINYLGPFIKLLMFGLIILLIITTDHLLTHSLEIIAKHSKTIIKQKGHNIVHIVVKGTGFIASLVRNIVENFNQNKEINNVFSNEECLPKPHFLNNYYLFKIGFIFLAMTLIILIDYIQIRLRRFICSLYYPKRENQRAIYLYNKMIKLRCTWREKAIESLKLKAIELNTEEVYVIPEKLKNIYNIIKKMLPKTTKCDLCSRKKYKKNEIWPVCNKCFNKKLNLCTYCWEEFTKCPLCS